jgi:SAM-dependent MidA family methyltransferase
MSMPSIRGDIPARLLDVLRKRIAGQGPMPVHEYMRLCAEHPQHGYWQRQDTVGAAGDFITAPEISQVFGELIGLWSVITWQGLGQPAPLHLVELGPGRGTLMRDALHAARIVPDFLAAATIHLVEISQQMRAVQRETLSVVQIQTAWHGSLEEVPAGPAIIIGNEFLDALPVRQLIACEDGWRERMVSVAPDGSLQFDIGPRVDLPSEEPPARGSVLELRAGEDKLLDALAARSDPYLALLLDYGPAALSYGDTLQAVHRHTYADPLSEPGTADLSTHVQFGQLAAKAKARGQAAHGPLTQAEFLGRLGIIERAQRLMSANPQRAGEIEAGVQRLISPSGMGSLFKAMVIAPPDLPPPVPFG